MMEKKRGTSANKAKRASVDQSAAVPQPRGKNATINDIARLAGVSKKTISRVINQSPFVHEETRQRVNEIIRQTGYSPNPQARALAFRKSFLIGLVYDNPNAEFVVNMQYGVLDALRGSGFELVVHPCERRSPDLIGSVRQFVERHKLHGVILLPPLSEHVGLLAMLAELECPHVSIACVRIEQATHRVVSSDRDACAEAGLHLAALGHKRIAVITGPEGHRSPIERLEGFKEGLARRGIQVPPELIVGGGYTFESGMQAAEMLLSVRDRPTAIFACNDEMAAGVYQTAHRLGIAIPEQLSVVGFDDSPIASRIWPPLTTIRLPIRLMARLAATQLMQPDGQPGQDASFVVPHLVTRNSTQAPAA